MNSSVSPSSRLQVREQVDDLRPDTDVEAGGRLVGDQEVRFGGQRPGDPDPLQLPAADLVRIALGERRR